MRGQGRPGEARGFERSAGRGGGVEEGRSGEAGGSGQRGIRRGSAFLEVRV